MNNNILSDGQVHPVRGTCVIQYSSHISPAKSEMQLFAFIDANVEVHTIQKDAQSYLAQLRFWPSKSCSIFHSSP